MYHQNECGCGCHAHQGDFHHAEGHHGASGFIHRCFVSSDELIKHLEEYLQQLKAEQKGVEEHIGRIKAEKKPGG
jgi:hypothetical protein